MSMIRMVMPQMGESINEGIILKWLKKIGDKIEKDETILEISTDKVDSEIPAPTSGIITNILGEEGQTVNVGAVIAEIETDVSIAKKIIANNGKAEPTAVVEPTVVQSELEQKNKMATEQSGAQVDIQSQRSNPEATGHKKTFYSPLVRLIAEKENISTQELGSIAGTGSQGRVTKRDVLQHLEKRSTQDGLSTTQQKVTRCFF